MSVTSNTTTIDKGFEKAQLQIETHLEKCMMDAILKFFNHAELAKEFKNMTGNTLTSYSIGLFKNGTLKLIKNIRQVDSLKAPTRRKLTREMNPQNQPVKLYDNPSVKIWVDTEYLEPTDQDYGASSADKTLRGLTPSIKQGYCLIMCTGTEYSYVLELAGLNVLTETFMYSPRILSASLKPLP